MVIIKEATVNIFQFKKLEMLIKAWLTNEPDLIKSKQRIIKIEKCNISEVIKFILTLTKAG
jgi:hypothetical protein